MEPIVQIAAKALIDLLVKKAGFRISEEDEDKIEALLERHVGEVENWASDYTFLGLGEPKTTRGESVRLSLQKGPRKFKKNPSDSFNETALLATNSVLLGDPGSGKTTTLKRLALSILLDEMEGTEIDMRLPIVIRLREVEYNLAPISEQLAQILGLEVNFKDIVKNKAQAGKEAITLSQPFVGKLSLQDVVAEILDSSKAVLFLDGLDEVSPNRRKAIDDDLDKISKKLKQSRIIVTCRTGNLLRAPNGFHVFEILPLNRQQISEISQTWLADSSEFLSELDATPYRDIIDRPILLTFLLFIFQSEGKLPDQPTTIYRKVVFHLLRDWDKQRGISRTSQYSKFDEDRKIDFLSELSYFLTYKCRGKIFSESEFEEAYVKICQAFGLPKTECSEVILEIQTHTGILMEVGIDRFQFSHLSLQEYFCANFISRAPFPDLLAEYLANYPPPLAVACALSADPSRFFTTLVEHSATSVHIISTDLDKQNNIRMLLSRLKVENPQFRIDPKFGLSVLYVFGHVITEEYGDEIYSILGLSGVSESVALCFSEGLAELKGLGRSLKYYTAHVKPNFLFTTLLGEYLPARLPCDWCREFLLEEIT